MSPEATIRLGHLLEREAAGIALTADERAESVSLKEQARRELPREETETAREAREALERQDFIREAAREIGSALVQVAVGFVRGLFRR